MLVIERGVWNGKVSVGSVCCVLKMVTIHRAIMSGGGILCFKLMFMIVS